MATNDVTIFQNSDNDLVFTIYADGSVVDITGQTVYFTVKKKKGGSTSDSDALIAKTATLTDASNGVATVTITNSDTNIQPGEYYYDIRRVIASVLVGYDSAKFTVLQTVTQRSS